MIFNNFLEILLGVSITNDVY